MFICWGPWLNFPQKCVYSNCHLEWLEPRLNAHSRTVNLLYSFRISLEDQKGDTRGLNMPPCQEKKVTKMAYKSSTKQESIPVGCIPPAFVVYGTGVGYTPLIPYTLPPLREDMGPEISSPPVNRMTDRCLWKHYLPATTLWAVNMPKEYKRITVALKTAKPGPGPFDVASW